MSWILVFLGFSLLVVLHEAGHFFAAKATGMRVERFFLFFPPKLVSMKRGETEYGIGIVPLGGYVKISGMNPEEELPPEVERRSYFKQPVWKRIVVTGAGPAVNIGLAFVIFCFAYLYFEPSISQTITKVLPGSPAAKVLQPGTTILSVDGRSYPHASSTVRVKRFSVDISSHKCAGTPTPGCQARTPVRLQVKQGGRIQSVALRPRYERSGHRTRIGVEFGLNTAHPSLGAAVDSAGGAMWLVTHQTASVFANLFNSQQRKQVSGIVGVSAVAHEEIDTGQVFEVLMLLALVSLSLGLINLLPILPLDGGHIFWSLVEKVRGQPVSLRVMERASVVGIALVAVLLYIGLSNDINHITGAGFNVR
jgi:regulator of sigma E protease